MQCSYFMIFIKAIKSLAISIFMIPIFGCALGTGRIFGSYLQALAQNPDAEDTLFQSAIVAFALVETYMVIVLFFALVV